MMEINVWAQATPDQNSITTQHIETASASPLSDKIPAHAPYAFGYDPVLMGGEMRSADLGAFNEWWSFIAHQAQDQKLKWTEEERKVWQQLASLPLPRSAEDWTKMGFDHTPRFWVYGLGLTPALVLEVPSPETFRTWIKHNIAKHHFGFKEISHPRGSYWRKRLKRWTILARLNGEHLHATLIPQAAEPVLLSYFLRNQHKDHLTPKLRRSVARLPGDARGSGIIQLDLIIDLFFGSQNPS